MNHKSLLAVTAVLAALLLFTAFGSARADPPVNVTINNVDGEWSNADTTSDTRCLVIDNTNGDDTLNNKIHAGRVNNDSSKCYTHADYGFAEGSGFGFDGSNGILAAEIDTPFLLGLITHYNKRVATDTSFRKADLAVEVLLPDAAPATLTYNYVVELDETANSPGSHAGNICPYPAGSFYTQAYIDFNGGFKNVSPTFGTPKDHPNVGGSPLSADRADNWLCGDKLSATLLDSSPQPFQIDGQVYEMELLGTSYPDSAGLLSVTDNPADVCGAYDDSTDITVGLESRELQSTQACMWAVFTAQSTPTAVSMAGPITTAQAAAGTSGPLAAVVAVGALMLVTITLWLQQRERSD